MNFWSYVDEIIKHPPLILVAILIAILAAHALKIVFDFINKRQQSNSLIISLELIVVLVLGYLVIHQYVERVMDESPTKSHYEPFLTACLLVFFTIISMFIYFLFRATIPEHSPPNTSKNNET